MSTPGSAAKGKLHDLYIVSRTHGSSKIPVAQSFNVSPKFTNESFNEFGTNHSILNTQTYNDSDVSFDIFETDLPTLYNAIMDIDPDSNYVLVDPSLMYQCRFTIYGNQRDMTTNKPFEGAVCQEVLIGEMSSSQDVNGNSKVTIKGTATVSRKIHGGGVAYNRCVSSAPPFVTASDVTFDGSNYAALSQTPVDMALPGTGGTTINYLTVLKNSIPQDSGFTVNTANKQLRLTTAPATTDVWETFIPYQP